MHHPEHRAGRPRSARSAPRTRRSGRRIPGSRRADRRTRSGPRRRGKPSASGTVSSETTGISGKAWRQHRDDDPLGSEIGLGHRRLVVLVRDLERVGIDPHDRLAGRPAPRAAQFRAAGRMSTFRPLSAASASRDARHRRSGVSGMSRCSMPSSASASTTALTSAGGAPIAPASPAPLTPSGLVRHGTTL